MEHSPLTLETVRSMILATRGLKAMPFTRVPVNEPWMAKRALDIGSLGVVFPFTSTRELAEQAVKSCKYPPQGIRGFGAAMAASRWGMRSEEHTSELQSLRHLVCRLLLEKKKRTTARLPTNATPM